MHVRVVYRSRIERESEREGERTRRKEGGRDGSFLSDSRNVSISLIEGLSHGKRVNSIYSRVGG